MISPILSIVIPTREGLSENWFKELFKVEGNVEFILVHPPGNTKYPYDDPRMQQIISPFRGEIIQRMTGLMTATGEYILSINCDEYLHPNLLDVTTQYFTAFPNSWMMRLGTKHFEYGKLEGNVYEWKPFPEINTLKSYKSQEIQSKIKSGEISPEDKYYLVENPIAPLENKFSFRAFQRKRPDLHGRHTENFDKKIWKKTLVKETLLDLSQTMTLIEPLKYIPFWCLDRLFGLYLQAKFFEKDISIGHVLPDPELLRIEDNPPQYSRLYRWFQLAEFLLVIRFPQYGYFWNLTIENSIDFILGLIKFGWYNLTSGQEKKATN